MNRSPRQKTFLIAALLLGVAPVAYGLMRVVTRGVNDGFWMALAASVFAAGVLASSIGRRRSRRAVFIQSFVILVISTVVAVPAAFVAGATSAPGIWAVAIVMGLCLAASSVFLAFARESPGR
jgi:peptidoglycan/LPS O-acetylase OafA/YrhL